MKCPGKVVGHTVLSLALCAPTIASDSSDATLTVTSDAERFFMSVPVSRVTVSLPRGDLELNQEPRTGASASPRYFRFDGRQSGIIVSGWFESANGFAGFEQFWSAELKTMIKNGVVLKGVPNVIQVGSWVGVAYDVDLGKPNVANSHMRAELVEAGTWVDLHISVTNEGSLEKTHDKALQLLKSVVVTERQQ